jgi:hypothetical protein
MQLPTAFLDAVLPSQGTRIYAMMFPGQPGQRMTWELAHEAHIAQHDIEHSIDWASAQGCDIYVAIAGYGPKTRTVKTGKNAGKVKIARHADNALWHRCLRIDIDVYNGTDPAKLAATPYRTKADAWAALKAFLQGAGMPLPLMVDSGYGIHAYWPFDRDVDASRWSALSSRLSAAMAQYGLVVDPTTTQDAARILRLPGTWNFKNGTAVQVVQKTMAAPIDPAYFEQVLGRYQPAVTAISGQRPAGLSGYASPLASNLHPPFSMKGVLKTCPGMLQRFQNQGATDSEPLWHAVLTLVAASDDPAETKRKVAWHLSAGHPSFDRDAFAAKWDQVLAQGYEPPTCETMARLGMRECATCPLRTTHKAPSVTGRYQPRVLEPQRAVPVPPQAPVAASTPPAPTAQQMGLLQTQPAHQVGCFLITPGVTAVQVVDGSLTQRLSVHNGIPSVVKQDPPPTPGAQPPPPTILPIGSYPMISAERLIDVTGKGAMTAVVFSRHSDGIVRVEFDHAAMVDSRRFASLLSGAGMHYTAQQAKDLQDKFMPEFFSQMQRIRQANAIASRCGWTDDFKQFILGTNMYSVGGIEPIRPNKAQSEIEAYHQAGDESRWLAAFNRVIAGGHDRAAIVALGIAAPLMAFSGVDGVLLNAYSPQSGVGKSTLCDAILSIWGKPDKLRKDFRDTSAATFHLASVSGNLPMVIDEFTNVEGKDLSSYIYTITQGRERHRLMADGQLRDNVHRWCLPAIATSNTSVHAKLQNYRRDAVAEAARVFEMRLYPLNIDPSQMGAAKSVIAQLEHNYGFLGPRLVNLFVAKGEAYWRKVVADRIAWWDQHMANDTGDRFRTVVAALIDIGAGIGKVFGLAFDRAAIVEEVKRHWLAQVKEFEMGRVHPEDFITNYITDNINAFTIFGGDVGTSLMSPPSSHAFCGEIRGVSNGTKMEVKSVHIPLEQLKQYIVTRNGDFKAVLEWMQAENARGTKVRRIDRMTFMVGTPRNFRAKGVEFDASVLGHAVLTVAPSPVANLNTATS